MWPVMRTDDLLGAIWLPGRRQGQPDRPDPVAGQGGAAAGRRVVEQVRVTGFDASTESGGGRRVTGVRTDRGDVEAEVVVNCAGQWAKALGDLVGVTVPLHSAEHFYVVTDQIEGVHPDLPIMRDPDGYTYFKEEVGGLVIGGFEPEAKAWVAPDRIPHPFEFQLLEEDWEHFSVLMDEALRPHPRAGGDRDPQVLQRARELHPGQPVPAGGGARAGRLLRRCRLQLGRHRLGRGSRPRARGVGHRR